MVRLSRVAVCVWGVILTAAALALWEIRSRNPDTDLIGLAFGMVAYTYGPLLGVLLAAVFPIRSHIGGLVLGVIFSVVLVAWFRPELPLILDALDFKQLGETIIASRPQWASEWFFPLNAGLTLGCGILGGLLAGEVKRDS